MAFIQCDFYSNVLDLSVSMNVILPEIKSGKEGKKTYKTLYLLHGLSDDHTTWIRRTAIERHVAPYSLSVVMPAVHRSFYTDTTYGHNYWSFISKEIPEVARNFFPLSDKREHNFVAGLSMGGYGAFKLALSCPEQYIAGASLSGALDRAQRTKTATGNWRKEMTRVFGDLEKFEGSENDIFQLARQVDQSDGPKPRLYAWCGTEDSLYKENASFREFAKTLTLDFTYEEGPGDHRWDHWDEKIQRVLEWLPLDELI